MNVTLIDYTGKGNANPSDYAASILLFTKSTRLTMKPGLLDEILAWPLHKKIQELEYMANTIPSSWEFCHYTFLIEGVTRAFTHQFVRTRSNSYAQQTMRILDVDGWDYGTGPTVASDYVLKGQYDACMEQIDGVYRDLIKGGAKIEDARGILPTNILTNIVMGCNFRSFVETSRKRSSPRVQGEYRDVLKAMSDEVIKVHPWAKMFFDRTWDRAAKDLDGEIATIKDNDQKIRMMKLLDQLRQIEQV